MKWLLWALLVGLGVLWITRTLRAGAARPRPPAPPSAPTPAARDALCACAHCGMWLPRADAVLDGDGRTFCGDAHRQAALTQGPRGG